MRLTRGLVAKKAGHQHVRRIVSGPRGAQSAQSRCQGLPSETTAGDPPAQAPKKPGLGSFKLVPPRLGLAPEELQALQLSDTLGESGQRPGLA